MRKIGIFGGSFNPPHNGHVNSIVTVQKKMGFDLIHIIPNNQNPLKIPMEAPAAEMRIEMCRRAFDTYGKAFFVDDVELKRGGVSYTIDTALELRKKYEARELFLIIGADNFEQLSQWKDYKNLIKEVNLVVTTRPGYRIPESADDVPQFLKEYVVESDFGALELSTGRSVEFITLDDLDISSSELRKKLRVGRPVDRFLPLAVETFIKEKNIYKKQTSKISDYKKFTEFCAHILNDKKALGIRAFDLVGSSSTTDYTMIASGTSTRHASSMAENLTLAVKDEFNLLPQGVEGVQEGRWVVVDYGPLIIHIFYDFVRQEYRLEDIWKDGKEIQLNLK